MPFSDDERGMLHLGLAIAALVMLELLVQLL